MATIRDKMGHCLHGLFTSSTQNEFAFSVVTRPRRLTQRRATDSLISLTRPVFLRFLRRSGLRPGLGEGELRSGLSPDCEPHSSRQRSEREGDWPCWPFAESEASTSQACVESDVMSNGPFC